MENYDGTNVFLDCWVKDLSRVHEAGIQCPHADQFFVNDTVACIQIEADEMLFVRRCQQFKGGIDCLFWRGSKCLFSHMFVCGSDC